MLINKIIIPVISSAKPVLVWSIIPATISAAATHRVKYFFAFIIVYVLFLQI